MLRALPDNVIMLKVVENVREYHIHILHVHTPLISLTIEFTISTHSLLYHYDTTPHRYLWN